MRADVVDADPAAAAAVQLADIWRDNCPELATWALAHARSLQPPPASSSISIEPGCLGLPTGLLEAWSCALGLELLPLTDDGIHRARLPARGTAQDLFAAAHSLMSRALAVMGVAATSEAGIELSQGAEGRSHGPILLAARVIQAARAPARACSGAESVCELWSEVDGGFIGRAWVRAVQRPGSCL